ncbi:MAG: ATP-binding protein [Bacillota bacterium]
MTNHSFVAIIINSITSALFAYVAFKFFFSKKLTISWGGELVLKNKLWFAAWYGIFTFHSAWMVTHTGASVVILGPLFVGAMAGWRCGLLTSVFGVAGIAAKAGLDYHSGLQYVGHYYFPTAISAVLAGCLAGIWHWRLHNRLPKIWQATGVCTGFILGIELPLVLLFPRPAIVWYISIQYFIDLIIASSAGMAMMIIVIRNLLQDRLAIQESWRINGELSAVKAVQQGFKNKEHTGLCGAPNVDFATSGAGQTDKSFFEYYYCESARRVYFAVFTVSELSTSATMAVLVCKTLFRAKAKRAALLSDIVNDLQYELAVVQADRGQSRWLAGVLAVDSGELVDIAANNVFAYIRNEDSDCCELANCDTVKPTLRAGASLVITNNRSASSVSLSDNDVLMTINFRGTKEELTLSIDLQETERLQPWVENYARQQALSGKLAVAARLVLEELTVNIIKYGFPQGSCGQDKIEISLQLAGGQLLITVADTGKAFNPLTDKIETLRQKNTVGGWGIKLVQRFAAKVEYEYCDGKNVISMALITK